MFNLWTFLFEVVNFLVLAYVLQRVLYRPLTRAIDGRREAIRRAEADATAARAQAAEALQQVEERLQGIEGERQALLREARDEATAERQRLLAQAEAEAQRRLDESRRAVAQERQESLTALQEELVASAVDVAAHLLREAADVSLHQQLAERLVATVAQLPAAQRDALRAAWQPADGVVVETAAALAPETLAHLTAVLATALGQPAPVEVQVCPALLAGLRVRLGGMVWDGSLAAQLDALRQAEPVRAGEADGVNGVAEAAGQRNGEPVGAGHGRPAGA